MDPRALSDRWRHRQVQANGIRLHVVEAGDGAGPVVLLLHGFPDCWLSWMAQIEPLVAQGFRVVAPDLRGYNESERPRGVASYRLTELAHDVRALAETYGAPVHLVGHDWGGVIAWHVAMHEPQVVRTLTVLNAPHPAAFRRALRSGWGQRLRSWYVLAFQLPVLPEAVWRAHDGALFRRILRTGAAAPTAAMPDPAGLEAAYLRAFSTRGAWTAAINYYRALLRHPPPRDRVIEADTLLLWGEQDPYLGVELTTGLDRWVPRLRVERIPGAGHWVQHSHATEVNNALHRFLTPYQS
jgi:epoxide hydrolase 4